MNTIRFLLIIAAVLICLAEGTNRRRRGPHNWGGRNHRRGRGNSVKVGGGNIRAPAPKVIGTLTGRTRHGVKSGAVTIVDDKTIHIKDFSYDGTGPDTFLYVGTGRITRQGDPFGKTLLNGRTQTQKLGAFVNQNIKVTLPGSLTVKDIEWLSVYCIEADSNFGDIHIPNNNVRGKGRGANIVAPAPKAKVIGTFTGRTSHGVKSGDVTILDDKTIHIKDFSYDGTGPDTFLYVGIGRITTQDDPFGKTLLNGNPQTQKLGAFVNQNIKVTLPGSLTVKEIEWLSVYCIEADANFGDIRIPKNLNV